MSLPPNPIHRLQLAAQVVQQNHPELGAWLHCAIEAHVTRAESIGRALSLEGGSGGRSPRRLILLERRNAILAQALQTLGGSIPALAREVRSYLTRVPAVDRARKAPALSWSPARVFVHQAAWLNVDMPVSETGLRNALSEPTELPPTQCC